VELQGWIRGHQDRSADVKPGELLRICAAVSKFALKDAPSAAGSVRLVERAALSAATGVTHDVWSGQGSASTPPRKTPRRKTPPRRTAVRRTPPRKSASPEAPPRKNLRRNIPRPPRSRRP